MKKCGSEILSHLRSALKLHKIDALYIPSSDEHNSEYVTPSLQRRAFVSNFYGSAGNVLITPKEALLFTDGRYWLEAEQSMYEGYTLMKKGLTGVPELEDWVQKNIGFDAKVGVYPYVLTVAEWDRLSRSIQLVPVEDLILPMMKAAKTQESAEEEYDITKLPIYVRPLQYTGDSCKDRRKNLVKKLNDLGCDMTVLSALDEVAWLTNLRGSDVPFNPVFYSYALVEKSNPKVLVFTHLEKISDEMIKETEEEIEFHTYESFPAVLSRFLRGEGANKGSVRPRVLVDELQTSKAVYDLMRKELDQQMELQFIRRVSCGPVQRMKSIKTDAELQGFRNCHIRDGASLTQFLAWLHAEITVNNNTGLSEFDVAKKLEAFRSNNELFVQLSFPTITAAGKNGAIVHYAVSSAPGQAAMIRRDELYLVDSGAQYWDGTTDVTRTVCFDTPKSMERLAYTLVLKGHIAINSAVFPKGTKGHRLDALARTSLWSKGLDYSHGTGHGVGSFLCVHEGPHRIANTTSPGEAGLKASMIVSNEPGYYDAGKFGIRIENLEEVVQKSVTFSEDGFLGFSTLTLVPLCRELIDTQILTEAEKEWINGYHTRVKKTLRPVLEARKDEVALKFLDHHTQPLP